MYGIIEARTLRQFLAVAGVSGLLWGLNGCGEKAGSPPPQVKLQTVALEDIKNIIRETSSEHRVLVIDFWATWCPPCVELFPSLHEGLVARGDGVRAVSITLDDPSREADAVAFLQSHDALQDAYRVVPDSAAQQALVDGLGKKWNNLVVPAILVYDRSGNLAGEFLEGNDTAAILNQVDRLLASGQEAQP